MKKQISDFGVFEPLAIDKVSQYSIKGGDFTFELVGSGNQGTTSSTWDYQRDDGKVACDVPDSWTLEEVNANANWH